MPGRALETRFPTRRALVTSLATATAASAITAVTVAPAAEAAPSTVPAAQPFVVDAVAVGADPSGARDSTTVLKAALVTAVAQSRFLVLRFPPGKFRIQAGLLAGLDLGGISIVGAGSGVTRLSVVPSGDTIPVFDLRTSSALIADLSIGAESGGLARALIELNASYCEVRGVTLRNAPDAAIAIGGAANATCSRIRDVFIRDAAKNGIQTTAAFRCTDSILDSVDIGRSGSNGVYLPTGSQTLQAVHTWGSGRSDPNNGHGILILGSDNSLVNCQSETNMGLGILCNGDNNAVGGGRYWGNGWAGIGGSGDRLVVSGASVYRNGIRGGGRNPRGAGIWNDGGVGWQLSGLAIFDDGKAVKAISATATARAVFSGRALGRQTQSYAIANVNGAQTSTSLLTLSGRDSASGKAVYRAKRKH